MSPGRFANPYPAYLEAAKLLVKNPGQTAAYESTGSCAILAGPGSGKTKTVTIKMARLLHEDIHPPRGIACITYSTECARELKQRLALLGIEPKRNVFIGTVHGFCLNHIVRPYARLAGIWIPDPIVVPDNETQETLFERAVVKAGLTEKPSYLKTRIERYRRTYLDRESPEWKEKDSEAAEIVEYFEESLHGRGFLDFDDMVLLGLKLIEQNAWIRKALKARFPVLIVDEYQDLGLPLHKIVLQFLQTGVRIVAVGDPDQSIYGFTGADPQLLRDLADTPGIEKISLQMNYRCGKTIVAGSIVALGEARDYEAAGDHEGRITFWECPEGIEEQAATICNVIIPQALKEKEGRKLGDIVVLYHDRYDAAVITSAVRAIGYKYVGGDKEIRYQATPLTRWLEDCAAWCAGGWKSGIPTLSSLIDFWLELHQNPPISEQRKELRQTLVGFLWSRRDPNERLKDWLDGILAAGLDKGFNENSTRPDEKKSLDELYSAASDPKKLGDFDIAAFGRLRGSSDHLNLVTLHSSKGLEFEVVIMMGIDQGRIPSWGATGPEPRRLFYVGLTRAEHDVHLVYSGWYENRYGRRFDNGPSEFLIELRDDQTKRKA